VIERALAFGREAGLAGVLAEPNPSEAVAGAPAIVMWNVGIQHRIGPYRIQVDIARDLARRGYASLRFDLSGMGDSEARQDSRPDHERALDDVREAMAVLEKRRGAHTFVPIGFCSSVDTAHALSLQDSRVVGACFLEGYAYRTQGFWLRYPRRLLDRQRWRRYLANRRLLPLQYGRAAEIRANQEERSAVGSIFARQYPTRQQFAADVVQLSSRGVRLLFLYVGGDTDFNHRGQFFETVGNESLEHVDVEYYGGADHTFFRVADRIRVVARIGEWMTREFPPPRAKAADDAADRLGSRGAA
jgi:dienelactone hydrolase